MAIQYSILRSACGTVLDKMETDQYKIIVDDACKWLKTYKEEKKQFDIIFGDLTDIPVHEGGSTWEFVRTVVKAALSLLPVGEFLSKINKTVLVK